MTIERCMKMLCMSLIMGMCLMTQNMHAEEGMSPSPAMAGSMDKQSMVPFTELAVETVRPTSFSFDSPLLRITGMYGVGHQAFLQDIQDLELVAVTNHLLENPYMGTAPTALKNMSPMGMDAGRETQRQFMAKQHQYLTAMNEVNLDMGGDMPVPAIILADADSGIAMEQLPEIMEDEQLAAFYDLNQRGSGGHRHGGSCDCDCSCCGCGSCGSENSCDGDSCGSDDDSCGCDGEEMCDEDDEDCCCDCCCEEEGGLLASGYVGYGGGGGGGGFGGFGGGGGGSGAVEQSAQQQQEQEIEIPNVPIPEPSTYLLMTAMLGMAAYASRRRREAQQEQ